MCLFKAFTLVGLVAPCGMSHLAAGLDVEGCDAALSGDIKMQSAVAPCSKTIIALSRARQRLQKSNGRAPLVTLATRGSKSLRRSRRVEPADGDSF